MIQIDNPSTSSNLLKGNNYVRVLVAWYIEKTL